MDTLAYALLLLSVIVPINATPNPRITAPAILPRQIQSTIVGYYSSTDGKWWTAWCNPGWRYCTSATYAMCGAVTDVTCNVPVSCRSTSVMVDLLGSSITCTSGTNTVCATNTVYQSPGDKSPVISLVCRQAGSVDVTVYRSFPESNTVTTSISSSRPSPPSSSTLASNTYTRTTSGSTTTSIQTATTSPTQTPTPKSKAWIAGPVIGGLVAVLGIVGGVLILRRRRSSGLSSMEQEQSPQGDINYEKSSRARVVDVSDQQYITHAPSAYGPTELDTADTKYVGIAELGPRY